MCGNGIRCAAKLAYDKGLVFKKVMRVETLAGVKQITLTDEAGEITGATVNMGIPQLEPACTLNAAGEQIKLVPVSMGNPHGVCICRDVKVIPLTTIGPALEHDPRFPLGINVEFVERLAPDRLLMRVWERGSGETLACGTGACAALAAAHSLGLARRTATVTLPGGDLLLNWMETGEMYMTGPARTVFEGEWPDEALE